MLAFEQQGKGFFSGKKEDDMTVGGYVFFAVFSIIILIVACAIAYESFTDNKFWLSAIAIITAMVLIISVFFGISFIIRFMWALL